MPAAIAYLKGIEIRGNLLHYKLRNATLLHIHTKLVKMGLTKRKFSAEL